MADAAHGMAMLLLAKKRPGVRPSDPAMADGPDDGSDGAPAEAPLSEEAIAAAHDAMDAVKLESPEKFAMAMKDLFMEFDSEPHEEGPDTSDEAESPDEMPPPAE